MANSDLSRLLGGSPGAVALKLVFMSILVGAFLSLFGLTPPDLLRGIKDLIDSIWISASARCARSCSYLVYGAVIVVPIWLADATSRQPALKLTQQDEVAPASPAARAASELPPCERSTRASAPSCASPFR